MMSRHTQTISNRLLLLLVALTVQVATYGQHSPDFAEKFMTTYKSDSTLQCVTVSPKMMMQLVKQNTEEPKEEKHPHNIMQAMAKLKSARIVNGSAEYFQKAETLLKKNKGRFQNVQEYETDTQKGAFYTRKDKNGQTVEFVMLYAEQEHNRFTIINLTGDIDEEFLCFLYNKSIKD